nr:response regulator transcription factor [Nocardioides lijunqiniae]
MIAEDDGIVRAGLRMMLEGHHDLDVVGEAVDGREALRQFDALSPDVVLMDIRMPRMDGLEATRALMSGPRPPRVIVLTTFDADAYIVEALGAGADGFLLKDTAPPEIVAAIRRVAAGEPMLSPAVIRTLLTRFRDSGGHRRARAAQLRLATLTRRESDIALGISRGLANTEIAAELHLSVTTVKGHVTHVFEKLGVTNRVQVAICVHDASGA